MPSAGQLRAAQRAGAGGGLRSHRHLTPSGADIGLCSARADDAYPGVRLRRAMAMLGDRVMDILLCEAEQDSTFDWAYHHRGAMETALPLAALEKSPEGDGYDWAKEWRACPANKLWIATWRTDGGPGVLLTQSASAAERAVAVEVTGGGVRDVVLINPAGGALHAGQFRLEGQGAVLRYEADRLTRLLVVGGSRAYVGDTTLAVP